MLNQTLKDQLSKYQSLMENEVLVAINKFATHTGFRVTNLKPYLSPEGTPPQSTGKIYADAIKTTTA